MMMEEGWGGMFHIILVLSARARADSANQRRRQPTRSHTTEVNENTPTSHLHRRRKNPNQKLIQTTTHLVSLHPKPSPIMALPESSLDAERKPSPPPAEVVRLACNSLFSAKSAASILGACDFRYSLSEKRDSVSPSHHHTVRATATRTRLREHVPYPGLPRQGRMRRWCLPRHELRRSRHLGAGNRGSPHRV